MSAALSGNAVVAQSGGPTAVIHASACGVIHETLRHDVIGDLFGAVTILEAMGRNPGWLAAATSLARCRPDDAPHLIYVPEIPFQKERFLNDVRAVHRRLGRVFIVASEGLVNEQGEYLTAQTGWFATDALGDRQLGGVADHLQRLIEQEIGIKARYNNPGSDQRNAMHLASKTGSDEAYRWGQEAVRQAVAGTSGFMESLVRESDQPYRCSTGLTPLARVANGVKQLPRHFPDEAGTSISDALRKDTGPADPGRGATPPGSRWAGEVCSLPPGAGAATTAELRD